MIVPISLAERSYDVVLGDGVRRELADLVQGGAPRARVGAIITSSSLRQQPWFDLDAGLTQFVIEVPEGEAAKSMSVVESVCEQLSGHGLSRHDVVIGVGGGAVTDVAGFVSAVYLRGVALVQVPTSLVGQVDAAIGGKTAVNLRAGKNLVGAFHQPLGVLCDFETLSTLPERERLGGLGEVAKCWLLERRTVDDLQRCSLSDLVTMSVELKAAIVSVDEFESGQRALLNYGHTLGHALELVALARDQDELRHGEAVAIGLAFAVRLAHALGRVDAAEIVRHDDVLATLGLARRVPTGIETNDLLRAMTRDKKAHHDLTFVLAGASGYEVVSNVDASVVTHVLEQFRGEA